MIHNGTDMLRCYAKEPVMSAKRFGGDRAQRRDWFWAQRSNIIAARLGTDQLIV